MTILVATSDDEAARSLCGAIGRAGRRARSCETAEHACEVIAGNDIRVLVIDGDLPGREQICALFRERAPWGRVFLMAGRDSSADARTEVLRKPFDSAEAAEVVIGADELAAMDTARRRLEKALEHGERLAAIGRIAATMAHEIANPLMVLRATHAKMARIADKNGNEDVRQWVADAELAVDCIAGVVQNVRGFARRERPVMTGLPVRAAVDMALRLVGPRARDNDVTLTFEPGEDAIVLHDPPRLSQAVMNLVANAIDAAAQKGKTVAVRTILDPSSVRIEVDDSGPGLPEELAARLFEPFVTTKDIGQGTGLGLSIARQIVEDHGGEVILGPLPVGGARAVVLLPRRTRTVGRGR